MMGLTNLNNVHLNNAKLASILDAITVLETSLSEFNINLSPEDRKRYGSINEQNKLLVNKVYDYRNTQPDLSVAEVDWQEFDRDYSSRKNLEGMVSRLENLITKLVDAKTLHDFDNYQAALEDYAFTAYKSGGSGAGFKTKHTDLKQFFGRTGTGSKTTVDKTQE